MFGFDFLCFVQEFFSVFFLVLVLCWFCLWFVFLFQIVQLFCKAFVFFLGGSI